MAPTPTISQRDRSRQPKAPESVYTEGIWCCSPRSSGSVRRRDRPKSRDHHNSNRNVILKADEEVSRTANMNNHREGDKRRKSRELKKVSGEIAAVIKQGLISGGGQEKSGSSSPFRIRLSPGRVSPINDPATLTSMARSVPSFDNLNSLLNTSFVPPASPPVDKTRSSPTLLEMMVHERELQPKIMPLHPVQIQCNALSLKQTSIQERILSGNSPGNQFNDASSSDVKLTLSSKDGISISLDVHRHILGSHSRFFAAKLSERWSKQQSQPFVVEISDCDDVELYVETIGLMYCRDLKRKLMKETVSKVLGMLKVSAAIVFEAGVLSCLEHLEAVPWAEEDEEIVTSTLSQLQIESIGTAEVLKRVSTEDPNGLENVLARLVYLVTRGSVEKARREMKNLVSRMLRENAAKSSDKVDVRKESLYETCTACLDLLLHLFIQGSSSEFTHRESDDRGLLVSQMARQADNLLWLTEILIDRNIADEFVRIWACQSELATLHAQLPPMVRHEVSRVTARLFIAIGKGQVLAPKYTRFMLLQHWLQPLMDDFAWLQRGGKGLDRKVVEEGISQTILTLPLKHQQTIMLAWFDRYLNNADDCPNLQKAFEVWWRRTFLRPCLTGESSFESLTL